MTADQLFTALVGIYAMECPSKITDPEYEEWKEKFLKERFSLISGLPYHREKHTSVAVLPRKEEHEQIFKI